jgi:hypothetical protein
MQVTTIGIDLAKHVFQVHDAEGSVVVRGKLRRSEVIRFFVIASPITYAARLDAATKLHGISSSMRL